MPDQAHLQELLQLTAFGGVGIALALGMLLAGFLFLGRDDRHRLRSPLLLFLAHLAIVGVELVLPAQHLVRTPLRVIAIAVLLLSMARTGFLLIVQALVGRRGQVPLPRIIQDILQGVLYAAVILVVLRAAGVELASILTTSAVLTAVIGLSLQETLGNLFAGLAIQAQRPFELGDWIHFDPDPTHVGRVVEINWRATRVLTIDNVEITVPNSALARASIRNYSRPTAEVRRAVTIVAANDLAPGEAHQIFLDAVRGTPGVLEQPPPDVQTVAFNDRGIEYRVRYWTTQLDRREPVDSAVRDRMWYGLQRAGHSLPGAQRHVFVHETGDEARSRQEERAAQQRERTLRYVDFFRELPDDAVHALAITAQRRRYSAGEVVIEEGSAGEELFVVEQGEVEVLVGAAVPTRADSAGPETSRKEPVRVATLGPSRFFGEMSLMTGEKRRATVRTTRETVLLMVGRKNLQPVLETHPALAEKISDLLAEREVALGQMQVVAGQDHKSVVEQRSDALLQRIRHFFSL